MAAVLQRQRTTDKSLLVARLRAVPRILILSATLTITTARKSPADFTPIAPINTGVTRAAHNKNQRQTAAQKTGRAGVLHPVPGFGCGLFADSSTDATLCRGDFESASLRRFSPRSMSGSHRHSRRSRVPRARVMTAGSEWEAGALPALADGGPDVQSIINGAGCRHLFRVSFCWSVCHGCRT